MEHYPTMIRRGYCYLLAFLFPIILAGQEDPQTLGITALQEKAGELAERNSFQAARPYLLEIANRFEGGSAEEQETLGPVYLFIGLSYLQEYSEGKQENLLQEAVSAFTKAIDYGLEEERLITVLEFRADAYRGLGKFEEAATDYEKLASAPLDRRLRADDRLDVLQKLSLTLQALRDWDRGIGWFQRFLEEASSNQQRALAAGLLLEAYIEQDNLEGILELLPLITVDNPSRYSVSLNVALMRAGDKLADKGRFAQAALLYNATLTRNEILRYLESREELYAARVERMRALGSSEERMADPLFDLENNRLQLEAVRTVQPYSSQLMARVARNYYLAGRDYEAIWAYLRFVENYPDDPLSSEFRFAAFITATKVGLAELSRTLGEEIMAGGSANEDFQKRVLLSLTNAYLESGDEQLFFESADDFLEIFPNEQESSQIIFQLGNYLLGKGSLDELNDRFTLLLQTLDGTPAEDGLYYWMGLSNLFQGKSAEAKANFQVLLSDEFVDSAYREDATYRVGMAYYSMDDSEMAEDKFNEFIELYPTSGLRGEVEFFLGEISGSEGEILDAIAHYDRVAEFTDSIQFITSAYFQKAKILERNDVLKRAASTYEEYIEKFGDRGRLTQAIYNLGEIRKKQGRPGEALTQYEAAILEYGNDPANIGVDSMIETYVEEYETTLSRLNASIAFLEKLNSEEEFRKKIATDRGYLYQQFSDDPNLDQTLYEGLRQSAAFSKSLYESAETIQPFLENYQNQLSTVPEEDPATVFLREYNESKRKGERTLAMRLQMALSSLGSPPRDPLVIREADLDLASPSLLVWIGEGRERIDPELAKSSYRKAIAYDENVEDKVLAYLNLADLLMEEGLQDEALQLYTEVVNTFPADQKIYRALIAQARIYAEGGQSDKAMETLIQILKTPDWRGEPHAEALYKVGVLHFENGEYPEAHGFFERTFLGYGLFDEWAARAYLMDAKALVEMGQTEDARRTLQEALKNDRYNNTEIYSELVEYANSI